jgi:hypothetical protein
MRHHRAQELELVAIELGPARLSVEAEHAPRLARPRAQRDKQLLLGPIRMDMFAPAAAAARIAACRLVNGRDARLRAGDAGQAVEVVLVVLVRQPFRRELPDHAVVVVARDEQRRWIEREPAGRQVVRHGARERVARLAPERHEVEALTGQFRDLLGGALLRVRAHGRMLRPPAGHRNTTFLEWADALARTSFASR